MVGAVSKTDPLDLLEQRLAFLQTQNVTIDLAQAFVTSLGVDSKKLIHLCHGLNRGCIFGIELDRMEELSSGVRPARGVHELWATDMIVSAVTVALQYAFEDAHEPLGTFPLPPKPEVKDHRSGRMAVLPEVSLVIFAPTIVHLYSHGGFIGLDIGNIQSFPAHRGGDRPPQLAPPPQPAIPTPSAQLNA